MNIFTLDFGEQQGQSVVWFVWFVEVRSEHVETRINLPVACCFRCEIGYLHKG